MNFKDINRNFLIRVTDKKTKKSSLHSARTYRLLINNDELVNKHFKQALEGGEYVTTYNLRRGLKIDFCSK